ncbi:MCE family protein [Nocardioides panacisoli]|uniref:MCE family protein n=1 Tax=Nocardioides panacisoli TaxID=627624 RepID=UPI001C63B09D|nr:MCE family protein [Nocardioides panacisoli]QYJ04878.1 MCE family protein [Nocardioides panacisoli]
MTVIRRIDRRLLVGLVVLLLVAAAVNVFRSPAETKTVTAHFPRAVSVYDGTDVRILGVTVGEVTAVIPEGNSVRVDMEYDASYDVPADAKAAVVTPTLVADRFVQLTPVYTEGAVMADGADIPLPDSGVPVELDRIYQSLQTLTRALGPNGVNADGALNNVLKAGQKALKGQGTRGNTMIRELSAAAETFGEGAGPLFETVTQLAEFTEVLADNDELVRAFSEDLTGVTDLLADESDELDAAVKELARAVGSVERFVGDNREALVKDVEQLTDVMHTIASEEDNLRTAVEIAPVALGNLHASFDHLSGSQNSRIGIGGNIWSVDGFLCGLVQQAPGMPRALKDTTCQLFKQLLEPIAKQLGWLPPEYASYLPQQTGADQDAPRVPDNQSVYYDTGEDTDMGSLLGGGE